MVLAISTSITNTGLRLSFTQSSMSSRVEVVFPADIWTQFPTTLRAQLRDNVAYLATIELGLMFKEREIIYDTALPLFKSYFNDLFFRYFLYSGDADAGEGLKYHADFARLAIHFDPKRTLFKPEIFSVEEKSVNTLTFGKESLLSYGLALELGLHPTLLTVLDSDLDVVFRGEKIQSFTNQHLLVLGKKFEHEFGVQIHFVENGLGHLRCNVNFDLDDTDLGSANVITEFMFLAIPIAFHSHSKYILFGNEYSCDLFYYNSEGYRCFPAYDQSTEWTSHMNGILDILTSGKVQTLSLVQPLQELAVAKILYQRYPQFAKYQMSCHADNVYAKDNRWCGHCSKCARCYVFMKALGFDPATVGLCDMSGVENKDYFSLFGNSKEMCPYDLAGVGRDEQLFAFLLAVKHGAQGELFDLYRETYYNKVCEREQELRRTFFSVYTPVNIPEHLWSKLKPIFEEELRK